MGARYREIQRFTSEKHIQIRIQGHHGVGYVHIHSPSGSESKVAPSDGFFTVLPDIRAACQITRRHNSAEHGGYCNERLLVELAMVKKLE
jgi:hypothetical protein